MSIAETNDAYLKAVNQRKFAEGDVERLGMQLRQAESRLRQLREAERKALQAYSAAVESVGG